MTITKNNPLTIYLLRSGQTPQTTLVAKTESFEIQDVGFFHYLPSTINTPEWVQGFFGDRISHLEFISAGSKAVFFIKRFLDGEERYFAITFGYGYSMIDKLTCVEDFGLKIVLNLVKEIRKIEKRTLASTPKNSIEQLSKVGQLSEFGIDVEQDLIEELTGKPTDPFFGGGNVTGKIAFSVSLKVDLRNVGELLDKCFEYYKMETYKLNFSFIDQIKLVHNPDSYNEILLATIRNQTPPNGSAKIWMAVPEIINWDQISGFGYEESGGGRYADLEYQDFLDSFDSSEIQSLDLEKLKRKRIFCFDYGDTPEIISWWSAFSCLYCEIILDRNRVILNNGKWYEIARDFADEVETSYLDTLNHSSEISYLPCYKNEHEGNYNIRLCDDLAGILMDKKNVTYGGGHSSIEFCDVFDAAQGTFIHVKDYSGSSVLSHLFAQGKVSAELFKADRDFRKKVIVKEPRLGFDPEADPDPSNFKIVFGIISDSPNPLNIPFFSKVNFRSTKKILSAYGYTKIFLVKIKRENFTAPPDQILTAGEQSD